MRKFTILHFRTDIPYHPDTRTDGHPYRGVSVSVRVESPRTWPDIVRFVRLVRVRGSDVPNA
jgi:hypothetical protein